MFSSVYHWCRFAGRHSNNLAALLMSEVVRRSRYMNVALESLIREIPRESLQIKMRKWNYIISWTRGLRGSSCRALGMPDLHEMRRENAEWENSNAVEIGREKEKKKCPGLVDLPVRLFFCFYVLLRTTSLPYLHWCDPASLQLRLGDGVSEPVLLHGATTEMR